MEKYMGQDASHSLQEGALDPAAETHQPGESARSPSESEPGMEALLRDNDYAFRSLRRGETVEGTVVRVDQDEVLIDVGLKSEGVIPSRELYGDSEDLEPLHVGDRALVYVMQPEGSEGHAILSLRRARMERSWRDIEELYNQGAVVEAPVVDFNKGGLIVDVKGVRGFVPVSQVLDLRNVSRQDGENEEVNQALSGMQTRRLPLKIIEINRSRNRLILSERAAVQERRTQLKDELMDQLEPGQIRRGVVSNLTSFGAFVDLGGADGLVHVSEMSYNRVNHPSEVLRVGQEIDVYVLSVDKDSKKIALSLKKALPDPWTTVDTEYRVGQVVPAVITKLAKFGAFAKVEEGLEGLIHLSELTDLPVQDAAQVVREGEPVNVKIIHINSQRRRLGLSVRQAVEPQPETESYGEVDANTPFADQGLEQYDYSDESVPTLPPTPSLDVDESASTLASTPSLDVDESAPTHDSTPSFDVTDEHTTDEHDTPAIESEPEASAPADHEPMAVSTPEASPASADSTPPAEEEERPQVSSAAPQRSASE